MFNSKKAFLKPEIDLYVPETKVNRKKINQFK